MRIGNLIFALVLEGLGIWIIVDSYRMGLKTLKDPGPGLFPLVLGVLLCLLSLPSCVQSLKSIRLETSETKGDQVIRRGKNLKIIFVIVLLTGYFVFLPALGFLPTTLIFLYGLFLMGYPRRWLFVLTVSLIAVILAHVIFSIFLNTPFPKGFLDLG